MLVFAAARPTIALLFKTLSWGEAFFAKFGKYQKILQKNSQNYTTIDATSLQKSIKKLTPKITKNIKKEPNIEPKGLPELSGKYPGNVLESSLTFSGNFLD